MKRILKIILKASLALLGISVFALSGLYVTLALSDGVAAPPSTVFSDASRRPLIFAHRGGADLRPENTFAAFDHSVGLKVDVLEIDVRLTSDGEFVVIHDATLDRTTSGNGNVGDRTLKEIKSLDAGFHFSNDDGRSFPHRGKGITVPTLEEVLERYVGANINIEFKDSQAGNAPDACRIVRGRISSSKTVIASVSGDFLYEFRKVCPEYPTSGTFTEILDLVLRHKVGVAQSYSPEMEVLQVPSGNRFLTIIDESFLRSAKKKGLGVHVWTINDENEMRRLIRLGVDGIVTDKPDLLIRIIDEELGGKSSPDSQ